MCVMPVKGNGFEIYLAYKAAIRVKLFMLLSSSSLLLNSCLEIFINSLKKNLWWKNFLYKLAGLQLYLKVHSVCMFEQNIFKKTLTCFCSFYFFNHPKSNIYIKHLKWDHCRKLLALENGTSYDFLDLDLSVFAFMIFLKTLLA